MTLEVNGIEKSYLQGTRKIEVLKDLSLSVEKGEVLSILGKSGSGKSTLLSLLCGLELPQEGSIKISDSDLVKMSEAERTSYRSQQIGIIFQHYHLVPHLSALENVILAMEVKSSFTGHDLKAATELLEKVGLSERLDHLPSELSGGEKQRVAIARAIVTKPAIILADEPSGSLDLETGGNIMDLLFQIVKDHQLSMILVTHDEALAKRTNRSLRLRSGKLEDMSEN